MCLAIAKPKGKIVPEEYIREGYSSNPHGAGLAWVEKGVLTIKKGYFNVDKFWEDYTAIEHLPALLHFRLATHGKQDQTNCHPFPMIDNTHAVIHNGIINIQSTDDLSDTGHFVKLVLEPIAKSLSITHPAVKYLVEQSVGSWNKIAVLNTSGKFTIFNEDNGHWKDGVWYSNHGYLPNPYFSQAVNGVTGNRMDNDYEYDYNYHTGTRKKYKSSLENTAANEREDRIRKIMRVEKVSRLDAEWFEESGWPWDYDETTIIGQNGEISEK